VPQEVRDVDNEIKKLSGILGYRESSLKRNYTRNYEAPFAPCKLAKGISKEKAILIEELKLDMPGVLVKDTPVRMYPYKEALAHVTGYIGEIDKRELEFLKSYGYSVRDFIGKDGIEKVADSLLRGRDGGMQIQIDNRGRQVEVLNFKKPRRGKNINLTIDAEFQRFIWRMMKDKNGVVIFMDVHNGKVLSLVSSPSYDPNESLAKILHSEDAPLLNRTIMGQYSPGSLFKIVIALTGLESEKILPDTRFFCQGKMNIGIATFNCWNRDGHGAVDMENAIVESCNVYFYRLGMLLGLEKIGEFARYFGFGKKTGIELYGEMEGFVPSRTWKRVKYGETWYAGDTANLSIGQGYLLVTPLQIVRAFSCVANGGELVEPHILESIGDDNVPRHKNKKLKIKQENIELVKKAMKGVVESGNGTGFRAWSNFVSISGKTGTSQVGGDIKSHAWFAGFAPSENPEVSFVVFLEHGGSGGDIAALIARKAVEYWYKNR